MNVWMKLLPLTLLNLFTPYQPNRTLRSSSETRILTKHQTRYTSSSKGFHAAAPKTFGTLFLIKYAILNLLPITKYHSKHIFFHATQGYIFKNVLTFLWVQGGLGLRLRVTSLPTQMFDHKIWELIFSLFRTLYECCIQLQCCTGITLKYICIFCGNHSGVLSID